MKNNINKVQISKKKNKFFFDLLLKNIQRYDIRRHHFRLKYKTKMVQRRNIKFYGPKIVSPTDIGFDKKSANKKKIQR